MKSIFSSLGILALAALASATALSAQQTPPQTAWQSDPVPTAGTWDVGVAAGTVGGIGLSVRRWFNEKDAIQVTCAPYYREEKYPDDDDSYYPSRTSGYANTGFLSVGALYIHRVGEFNTLVLSTFGGGNYTGVFRDRNYVTYEGPQVSKSTHGTMAVGGGFGLGVELWRVELDGRLGLRAAYDLNNETRSLTPSFDVSAHFHIF